MSSADLLSNSLSSVDVPIHSLPPSQSHQGKKYTAQLPQYKLTGFEIDLLKYTQVKDDEGIGKPYMGRITELCPHLKAATALAICKTLIKSPNGH